MFSTDRKTVTLVCKNDCMDAIIDRFGEKVAVSEHDGENFKVNVELAVNNVFFSWIFGFCGKVKIVAPEDVKEQYREMLVAAVQDSNV